MKFNKDTFLNDITDKVQSAIDKNLITREDVANNDTQRLHGFIQYELLEYIEDRKFAIDVLKDFNYDEKTPWEDLQKEYGTFKSLMDIALVNLWKFLQSEGCTKFEYYNHDNKQTDHMLDIVHDKEDFGHESGELNNSDDDHDNDYDIGFGVPGTGDDSEHAETVEPERPRRKIRIAH